MNWISIRVKLASSEISIDKLPLSIVKKTMDKNRLERTVVVFPIQLSTQYGLNKYAESAYNGASETSSSLSNASSTSLA